MKNKIIGFCVFFIVYGGLSQMFQGAGVPFPSNLIPLAFIINALYAVGSIFFQRVIIIIYEMNVFDKDVDKNVYNSSFKYFTIVSSGLNYYAQTILVRFPFVINKLLAIVFLAFNLTFIACSIGFYDN